MKAYPAQPNQTTINRLMNFRRVAARSDKLIEAFTAFVWLASI
jgi:hypothetical protein